MRRHPVLIVNTKSGDGRASAIGLVPTAERLGIETVTLSPGEDLAGLALSTLDRGCDHLLMAGGDGSLGIVAQVCMARGVAFSCVPVGTRNHFAMDLGLDRHHPLGALDAAFGGVEKHIDVGTIDGQVFLNNVSFGPYPRAIADPEYRNHRARSMADAATGIRGGVDPGLALTLSDGRFVPDVEILLISNNPYRFTGPPDFGRRSALDTGTLGVIVGDRRSGTRGPVVLSRLGVAKLVVRSDAARVQAGVDGELRFFEAPIDVAIAPKSLRIVVPKQTKPRTFRESIEDLNERAVVHLSGLPTLPRPSEVDVDAPLLRPIDRIDEAVFQRIAGWQAPVMDRLMPALSEAASHSKIWMAFALLMAVFGGKKGRTTAAEGLVAIGLTSVFANLVAKGLFRRPRPANSVPEARRLPLPASFSMPSGHTASAAAFARVVGTAYPALRPPLTALAASIGFSRVYTGVHHPTDVVAGWALGTGSAHVFTGRRRSHDPLVEYRGLRSTGGFDHGAVDAMRSHLPRVEPRTLATGR